VSDTLNTARREWAGEYEGMTFYELCCLVIQRDAELAALREAVRDIDGFIGTSEVNQLAEWHRWEQRPEVQRALEEKR